MTSRNQATCQGQDHGGLGISHHLIHNPRRTCQVARLERRTLHHLDHGYDIDYFDIDMLDRGLQKLMLLHAHLPFLWKLLSYGRCGGRGPPQKTNLTLVALACHAGAANIEPWP